jgi:hypothetical protein
MRKLSFFSRTNPYLHLAMALLLLGVSTFKLPSAQAQDQAQDQEQAQEQVEPVAKPIQPMQKASDKPTVAQLVPQAQSVGQGLFRYMFWRVYEAELLAPAGQWRDPQGYDSPFALQLTYLRDLSGAAIAERSVEEMREQGFSDEAKLAIWLDYMTALFPDVSKGTRLIGVHVPGVGAHFFQADAYLGEVPDAQFSRKFFDIWLSENTTAPGLRRLLLGSN